MNDKTLCLRTMVKLVAENNGIKLAESDIALILDGLAEERATKDFLDYLGNCVLNHSQTYFKVSKVTDRCSLLHRIEYFNALGIKEVKVLTMGDYMVVSQAQVVLDKGVLDWLDNPMKQTLYLCNDDTKLLLI